jgi:hypothetical protein
LQIRGGGISSTYISTFLILDKILAAVAAKLFADFHAEIYSAEGAK